MAKLTSSQSLIAFLAVAEEGSINAAAERLHVSQPALTRTIRELEEQIGAQLFERNAKGVTLTAFGHTLVGHAMRLRSELEAIERNVSSYRSSKRSRMAIGAVPAHPVALMAKAIADMQRLENVEISVSVGSQLEMLEMLRSGKIEMIFGPLVARADGTDLLQELINHEGTEFYCRGDHPLAGRSQPTAADLGSAQWALGHRGTTHRARIDEHFAREGVFLDVPVETDDVSLRRSIVAQSDLISAFQSYHVYNEVKAGLLIRIDYARLQEQHPIGCIRLAEHTASSRRLVELTRENYRSAGLT